MRLTLLYFGLLIVTLNAEAQEQGIKGKVLWLHGNQMPGPGKSLSRPESVSREVYIYKAVRLQDLKQSSNGFYTKINAEFVTKVLSHASGTFKVNLPAGEYSVFVKESQGLFGNIFDIEGRVNYVVVKPKKYSNFTITVDYEVAY